MGYGTRNGSIRTFWPDDTDTCFYIPSLSAPSLAEIIQRAKAKWGEDIDLEKIDISSEYIHTDCLTYDLFDRGDWTDFVIVSYRQ